MIMVTQHQGSLLIVGGFADNGLLAGWSAPVPELTVVGDVVTLEPVTVTLADGRTLQVTLTLQLREAAPIVDGTVDAAPATGPAIDGTKARHAAVSLLGQRTHAQLLAPEGRAAAQQALSDQVRRSYNGDVLGVDFAQFMMQ